MFIETADSEIISMLISLGLNEREAKVYYTLLIKGQKHAKEISILTGIPQPHVYSILKSVNRRGLVDILQEDTQKYRVIPLDAAVDRLIGEKESALSSLKNQGYELSQKLVVGKTGVYRAEFKPFFGKRNIEKKIMDMLHGVSRDILGVTSSLTLINHTEYIPLLKNISSRRINFRVLIEIDAEKIDVIKPFIDAGGEIKFLNKLDISRKIIVDEEVLLVEASWKEEKPWNLAIWTDHKEVVKVARERFEERWETALSFWDIKKN